MLKLHGVDFYTELAREDVDVLIFERAIETSTQMTATIVGEDVDLLILLLIVPKEFFLFP